MKKFFTKKVILLLSLTLIVALISFISVKTGTSAVSNTVGVVIAPVQKVFASGIRVIKNAGENILNSSKNAKENEKLNKKVLSLQDEIRMLEGYKTENERLHELLELKNASEEITYTAANIIGKSSSDINSLLTIDKGSKDGVRKNSIVKVPEGLVGVVSEVSLNYAKVKTIFDAESSVSAICARSSDMGIVEGKLGASGKNTCVMNYIDTDSKIVVGDSIETTSAGGIFPSGIFIGKVKSIKTDERNLSLNAVIEAGAKISNIDKVMVSIN